MRDNNYLKAVVDHYEIKEVLILENQDLDYIQKGFVRNLTEVGVKVHVAERAYTDHAKPIIMQALQTIDTIFFESQFMYWEQVQGVGLLLKAVKRPLKIFGKHVIENNSLMKGLEDCFSMYELADMSHHKLYELNRMAAYTDDFELTPESFAKPKDLTCYKLAVEREERLKAKALRSSQAEKVRENQINMSKAFRTGRRVKILKIEATGKQWSNLKEGTIVDEWDCLHMDPNPNRGTWVMGTHEFVKLLNDSRMVEWEYENPDCLALALEILSMCQKKADSSWIFTLSMWINRVMPEESREPGEFWNKMTEFLDVMGVERRYYRSAIVSKLEKYGKAHVYFGEDRRLISKNVTQLSDRIKLRLAELELAAIKANQKAIAVNDLDD